MKIVSLILARGGSKGIPKKNILKLRDKPLIYYSISSSLGSSVSETWVSTDDEEIASVAHSFGAKVIKRPQEISQDFSKSEDALLHFAEKEEFDILVFIQNTSPLLESSFIDEGIDLVKAGKCDSVFSSYREHWTGRWNLDLQPIGWDPNNRPRRQDVQETLVENGAFYITTRETLMKSKLRYGGRIGTVEMPFSKSIQIDTSDEVELIEKLLKT